MKSVKSVKSVVKNPDISNRVETGRPHEHATHTASVGDSAQPGCLAKQTVAAPPLRRLLRTNRRVVERQRVGAHRRNRLRCRQPEISFAERRQYGPLSQSLAR